MKEISNRNEIEKMKNELFENRRSEQKANNDYSYRDDGSVELCDDCGATINSHGHCPRCNYK